MKRTSMTDSFEPKFRSQEMQCVVLPVNFLTCAICLFDDSRLPSSASTPHPWQLFLSIEQQFLERGTGNVLRCF